jgi:hypothetical protein
VIAKCGLVQCSAARFALSSCQVAVIARAYRRLKNAFSCCGELGEFADKVLRVTSGRKLLPFVGVTPLCTKTFTSVMLRGEVLIRSHRLVTMS